MNDYPALTKALCQCIATGIPIPDDILSALESIGIDVKALQEYDNTLTRLVSIYLNELRTHPGLTGVHFGVAFANAVEAGLNDAWRAGMRENEVTEMLPEWQDILNSIIAGERGHIPDFAYWLTDVAGNAETMGEAMTLAGVRLSLWIGRYMDVYNQAVLASADEKTKLEWIYGDTQHCTTCEQLNGVVAYTSEWDRAGLHPQQPPNGMLECGGWRCQCQLVATDKRRSANVMDRLLSIGLGN